MKAMWTGQINFGLVNIPVAAYAAVREDKISFKQLRKADLSPIRYKKVAETDGKEVPADQILKGYEYEKSRYVTVTSEELEELNIESTKVIEITEFVNGEQIDLKFIEKPYVLEAGKGGLNSYSLLFEALADTGKIGIGKVAIRNREYLVGIKANGKHLLMLQLRFASEIADVEEVTPADRKNLNPQLVKLAKQLINQMSVSIFDPDKYSNNYREALEELIQAKVLKKPIKKASKATPVTSSAPDILETLQASLKKPSKKATKATA